MKLIIDIDERAYKGCVKLKNNDDMGVLGFHLINATANSTPLEEELEKINQEIGRIATEEGGDFLERPAIDIIYEAQKIIKKHISELKEGAE